LIDAKVTRLTFVTVNRPELELAHEIQWLNLEGILKELVGIVAVDVARYSRVVWMPMAEHREPACTSVRMEIDELQKLIK
jgi:hypothetical protein